MAYQATSVLQEICDQINETEAVEDESDTREEVQLMEEIIEQLENSTTSIIENWDDFTNLLNENK